MRAEELRYLVHVFVVRQESVISNNRYNGIWCTRGAFCDVRTAIIRHSGGSAICLNHCGNGVVADTLLANNGEDYEGAGAVSSWSEQDNVQLFNVTTSADHSLEGCSQQTCKPCRRFADSWS